LIIKTFSSKKRKMGPHDPGYRSGDAYCLMLSQSFLPGGGGLEQFMHYVILGLMSNELGSVEVVCLSSGLFEEEFRFDQEYIVPVYRVRSKTFATTRRLNQKFNTLVGGSQRLTVVGKISMLIYACGSTLILFRSARRRVRSHTEGPIVVHCVSFSALLVAHAVRLTVPANIKVVFSNQFTYQRSGFELADGCIAWLLRRSAMVVNVSKYSAHRLITSFQLDPTRNRVAYSWMDIPEINSDLKKLLHEKFRGKVRILFVGRIVPEKGIDEIIALAQFIEANGLGSKYDITVVGDSAHEVLADLIKAAKDSACLNYVGRVNKPDLWRYYASHDIFLFPAQSDGEGCNRVIVEAYALGTPVVAPDYGAIKEMLQLFPVQALVSDTRPETLLNAIDDAVLRARNMGRDKLLRDSREVVTANFSSNNFDVYRDTYLELYSAP
jgi:glycosyltransferase involved in cell wall biosynthesis